MNKNNILKMAGLVGAGAAMSVITTTIVNIATKGKTKDDVITREMLNRELQKMRETTIEDVASVQEVIYKHVDEKIDNEVEEISNATNKINERTAKILEGVDKFGDGLADDISKQLKDAIDGIKKQNTQISKGILKEVEEKFDFLSDRIDKTEDDIEEIQAVINKSFGKQVDKILDEIKKDKEKAAKKEKKAQKDNENKAIVDNVIVKGIKEVVKKSEVTNDDELEPIDNGAKGARSRMKAKK